VSPVLLLGDLAGDVLCAHRNPGQAEVLASMRVAMTTRSRYTEEDLAEAVGRGIGQYVLLGAGNDERVRASTVRSGHAVRYG
jgi:O-methyltransferase involved in polyketide biosynthesis